MATEKTSSALVWEPSKPGWGRGDVLALAAWTVAVVLAFWDAVRLRGALFYFDITEINYPYRAFLSREYRAGRFSTWLPDLYCGLPLFSESQAGFFHPSKLLYLIPGLPVWGAFNLDTVLSVWLTGVGTYGWLRRHVGPSGALTGAAIFGLSGYTWAHLVHTSMINALASVPLAFWALECAWEGGRPRALVLGALALACQVFAGHLQDTILTGTALGLYGVYWAATDQGRGGRSFALGAAVGMVLLAGALSAVQWIPSKELLDRSPRAENLTRDELTYGSWSPELLPTLIVREAYGTRARDTDWMDGFYPYHEMNAYLGVIALALAVIGAAGYRDRWVGFWLALAGVGGLFMLGRYTFLFDYMHRFPALGRGRIPVRYHLWVALAVSALAAVGVDRLSRPGLVRLRGALVVLSVMILASIPILIYVYAPVWTEPGRWTSRYHQARYHWLSIELAVASARTGLLALIALTVARLTLRQGQAKRRQQLAAVLPVLIMADLLGAHWQDAPTVSPTYWTRPPASVRRLLADPETVRIFGLGDRSAGEPGYASEPVEFFSARDTLAWSLPAAWGLSSSTGATPILSKRLVRYDQAAIRAGVRFEIEGVTHLLSGNPAMFGPQTDPEQAGSAYIVRNQRALPRARLIGRPVYAKGEVEAAEALVKLGREARSRLVVEDPTHPLPGDVEVSGLASITYERPDRVEVATDSTKSAYLVLADTFDPGWSATIDGRPAPIYPAYVAFRAVLVPEGRHRVVFRYQPAGLRTGIGISLAALVLSIGLLVWPGRVITLNPAHGDSYWPRLWPVWALTVAIVILAASTVQIGPSGTVSVQNRWTHS
ncbi:MAG: YfhO family protein, partial [Isosphaeraceae bacterium]